MSPKNHRSKKSRTTRSAAGAGARHPLGRRSRERIGEVLVARLADALDLQSQTKQAHWNAIGPNFIALHELFDVIAGEIALQADTLAERAVTLGAWAPGSSRAVAKASSLPDLAGGRRDGLAFAADLADRLGRHAGQLRDAIEVAEKEGDAVSADLFTQMAAEVEKRLWFLESHLES